jgi:hypothetical protein
MDNLLSRLRRFLLAVAALLAILYAADYVLLRYRVSTQSAFDTVTVREVYAVPRNDHKLEYLPDEPRDETCVKSLFPHLGDTPCWYLRTHTERRINL